jgi:hypothetical protein
MVCLTLPRALDAISKSTEQQAKRGKAQALLHKSKDAEQLKQLSERLEQTHKRFMVRLSLLAPGTVPHGTTCKAVCEIRNQLALGQLITDADRGSHSTPSPYALLTCTT